jgi:hypothetical protein
MVSLVEVESRNRKYVDRLLSLVDLAMKLDCKIDIPNKFKALPDPLSISLETV